MKLIKMLDRRFPKEGSKQKKRFAVYECPKCLSEFETCVNNVTGGHVKCCNDCGKDLHGMSKTKLYYVYRGMINRCSNKEYIDYAGRGIIVCDEWLEKASNFFNWAKTNGYKEGLTIDRINNDGNYEPSNCRWTDYSTQATNTRIIPKNNTTGYRGVYCSKGRYRSIIIIENKRINIGTFDTKELAAIARNNYIDKNKAKNMKNSILE